MPNTFDKKTCLCILGLLTLLYALSACDTSAKLERRYMDEQIKAELYEENLITINEEAADELLGSCNVPIDQNETVIVTSIVNIDDMHRSSTLGRMSSEMIANRLAQHGYSVREIKMGRNIFVSEAEGEFILSRELHEIGEKHDVQGFIVGTYAKGETRQFANTEVFVSLRYVGIDNIIRCSHNYIVSDTDLSMWQ